VDFGALALVFAAAQFALDGDMQALLETGGVFAEPSPGLDAVPFGPFGPLAVLLVGRLGGDREGRNSLSIEFATVVG
jgi:hypothetical protein